MLKMISFHQDFVSYSFYCICDMNAFDRVTQFINQIQHFQVVGKFQIKFVLPIFVRFIRLANKHPVFEKRLNLHTAKGKYAQMGLVHDSRVLTDKWCCLCVEWCCMSNIEIYMWESSILMFRVTSWEMKSVTGVQYLDEAILWVKSRVYHCLGKQSRRRKIFEFKAILFRLKRNLVSHSVVDGGVVYTLMLNATSFIREREREREREKEREREWKKERERERERGRDGDRDRESERDWTWKLDPDKINRQTPK